MTKKQAKKLRRGDVVKVKQYPTVEGLIVNVSETKKRFGVYLQGTNKRVMDARPSDLKLIRKRSQADADYEHSQGRE